ncbi:MAG: hypothetical protein STSR0004_00020 [Peptococcaceae bacterium]
MFDVGAYSPPYAPTRIFHINNEETEKGMSFECPYKIPRSWVWTRLNEVSDIIMGQSPPSNTYNTTKTGLPFYQGKIEFGEINPIAIKWCNKPKKIAKKNDILLSVRAPVGPTNICYETSCIGRGLAAIRYKFLDVYKYVFYFLRSIEKDLSSSGVGSTFSAISKYQIENLKIPLPPLAEQHRIVARIEELFTKLDAGVAALKKVKVQLKRYRQAVLKYAFAGKLTEEWRENHKNKLEPAAVLLEQIKEERKKAAKVKLKELPSPDTSVLPEIPEGWVWTRLGEICEKINPGFPSGKHNKENRGVPHLRPMNINVKGEIDFSVVKYVQAESYDSLLRGDVLFNNTNSPELLGKTAYIKKDTNWAYSNHMTRIRLNTSFINSACISYCLHNLFLRGFFKMCCTHHVNQASINSTFLSQKVPLPLPTLPEQHKIVEEIERRFSIADEVEKIVEQSLKQAERLRTSILKRAFEGKLVPQDPDDEPAEKLLERIEKEKRTNLKEVRFNGGNSLS